MILSIHVPKCAGTSFRHVLQHVYGPRLWLNYGAAFARGQASPGLVPATAECVHGHFLADTFSDLYPNATYITWVRHPVERVVSNYHHFLRGPDMRDDCCRRLHEGNLSLGEFAELDWMRNEATRYLAGMPISAFAFVGVAESFASSLAVFADTIGWREPLPRPRDNVNPGRTEDRYPLSSREFRHILDLNQADYVWYRQACARLSERAAAVSRAA